MQNGKTNEPSAGAIAPSTIERYRKDFDSDPKNLLALNVVTRADINEIAINRQAAAPSSEQAFSVRITNEAKITHQKASGRCWLFAATNVIRLPLMKEQKLDNDFEFSQNYLLFWDKFEKANYFLESMLGLVDEDVEGRLISYLLQSPVLDGGQYDMFINVVEKYGLVPKRVFPETFHSSLTRPLNWIITFKLREFASILRKAHKEGKKITELRAMKDQQLNEVYRILVIFLGAPPQKFDWTFHDKDKKFNRVSNITPRDFVEKIVKFKVTDFVSLINDPRNPYYKLYTVDYLGNVVGGRPVLYINLPIEDLKKYARQTLEADEPVWFGCDVDKFLHKPNGVMDLDYFCYDLALGTTFGLNKADRLRYGESLMTHAMVFTAVDVVDGKTAKWRVENSWGDTHGDKGYFVMTDRWFDEYLYQIVVNQKILPKEITSLLTLAPVRLPAWDPMGSLAK